MLPPGIKLSTPDGDHGDFHSPSDLDRRIMGDRSAERFAAQAPDTVASQSPLIGRAGLFKRHWKDPETPIIVRDIRNRYGQTDYLIEGPTGTRVWIHESKVHLSKPQ